MADTGITSGSLIQDWYDRYVRPKKEESLRGIFSNPSPGSSLSLGLPAGTSTVPTAPPPVMEPMPAPLPVADTSTITGAEAVTPTVAPETPAPSTEGVSWTDKLNKGLQDPTKMGLLGMGLSMMATPPRAVPYSAGEVIGGAGLHGLKFFQQAVEEKRKADLMAQTAEEHKLTREDRRTAAEDRGQYYRDVAETRRLTAESQAEARKATAAENAVLDVPIDPAVAKHYGIKPETTVRMFNKMQTGLVAMAKPEKETKPDAFTKWYEAKMAKNGEVTAKDLENWHRGPGSGGGTDSGPGKVGAIGQVNRELVAAYLPSGRENLTAKGPAGMEELKGMMVMLGNTDQYGGTVNDARLRESLSVDQRKEYDFVKRKAQDYSRTMTPANAVARAQEDWKAKNPGAPSKLPAAAPVKPGVTAKKVKMPDGSIQEFDAAGNRVK